MGRRFFVVICLMGLFALLSSTMSKSPVLALYAKYLFVLNPGTPEYLLGFVAAASTIPGVLISLPAGTLSDRLGRGKVLFFSGAIFASAPFFYILIADPLQLIFVRFYHGFATAIFGPVANAAIIDRYPESKGEKISLFSSITYIGRFTAPWLGGYILLATVSNYHELYILDGFIGIIALLIAFGLRSRSEKQTKDLTRIGNLRWKPSAGLKDWREVASNGKVLIASFVEASQYYTFGAFEFFLIYYASSLGIDTLFLGALAFVQPFTVFVAKPAMGRFSDRIGRRTPIRMGLIIGAVSLVALPFANEFITLVIVSILYGLGFSLVTSSTPPLVSELCRKEVYGSAMGFLSTIMDVGQVLGPIVTGFVLVLTAGYFGAFALLSLVQLVSLALFSVSSVGKKPAK